jgi:AcrR family transcriptional regulator
MNKRRYPNHAIPTTAQPKKLTPWRPGELRDALVMAGRTMFEEDGTTEISLRALARRLGVSEAAPFKHFKGKESLLAAVASSGFRELAARRRSIVDTVKDAPARARAMMTSYVEFGLAHRGLFDLMIGPRFSGEERAGELEEAGAESFDYFAQSIFALARDCDWPEERLEVLSHAAWSVEHGIASLIIAGQLPRGQVDTNNLINFTIELFLSVIVAGPKTFDQARDTLKKVHQPAS